jgi:hypothetical protein
MRVAEELPWLVETLALRRLLPIPILRLFLRHPRWLVALAAAVGECNSQGAGAYDDRVRAEIRSDWREAILRAKGADCYGDDPAGLRSSLPAILASDPQLAFAWLQRRLSEPDLPAWVQENGAFARAARALGTAHRAQLLAGLQDSPITGDLVGYLVGNDPDLYRRLLARTELRAHHLRPLLGEPDEAWTELASAALEAGYAPEDVAEASGPPPPREAAAETLAAHPDPRLREVARHWQNMTPPSPSWIAERRR